MTVSIRIDFETFDIGDPDTLSSSTTPPATDGLTAGDCNTDSLISNHEDHSAV